MKDLDMFVDNLIEQKGLSYLDEKVLVEMKKDLSSRVEDRINAVIITNIPTGNKKEFEELLESDTTDSKVRDFCATKIPNLQDLITIELARFQSVYLNK